MVEWAATHLLIDIFANWQIIRIFAFLKQLKLLLWREKQEVLKNK